MMKGCRSGVDSIYPVPRGKHETNRGRILCVMSWLKWVGLVFAGLAVVAAVLFLDYYLPSTELVQVTGHEVKRMDTGTDKASGQPVTRDVRFIYAKGKDDGKDYAFRNEDTGWGWPPYFKFDSGDLTAKANNIKETQPDSTGLLTYYGWRITYFDLYPNAVDLEVVDPDYKPFPLFKILFVSVLIVLVGLCVYWFRWGRYKSWLKQEGSRREG